MIDGIDGLSEDFIVDVQIFIEFFNTERNRIEKIPYYKSTFFTDQETFFLLSYDLGFELNESKPNAEGLIKYVILWDDGKTQN